MRLSRDGWSGIAILVASLVLFALTLGLKPSALVPIGPGFYPRIVLGITAVLAAGLIFFDLRKESAPGKAQKSNYGAVVLHFAVFGVYVLLLPGLGFRMATFAYLAAANALMAPPQNPAQWLRVLAIALGATIVTYYAFDVYLTVLLPRGRWTSW